MKKKIGPPWLVARIAAGFSFFALSCSILFSDVVQVQDHLELFTLVSERLFDNTIFSSYYEETKYFFVETLNLKLKEKFSCPNYLVPSVLFIVFVFTQFGLMKGKLEKNIKEIYKPLKEEEFIYTYRFNLVFFVLNVAAFSFWWIRSDFPAMFFSFGGCVLQYLMGIFFNYKYDVWRGKCFENE